MDRPTAPIEVGPAFQRENSGVVSGFDGAVFIVRIHGAPAGAAPVGAGLAAAAAAGAPITCPPAAAGVPITRPPGPRRTGAKHWPHHSASSGRVAVQLAQLSISLEVSVRERPCLSRSLEAPVRAAGRLPRTPAAAASDREGGSTP